MLRIIISPAKKMRRDNDALGHRQLPQFIREAEILLSYLKGLSYDQAKGVWKCNDQIATLNYQRIHTMDLYRNLTPAILAYEGIQYQYMAPGVFTERELEYLEEHLRILSGFYGLLKPFDGVVPYRLEMQARLQGEALDSLYHFWGRKLADQLFSETNCIVNLASKEYSKCISDYLHGKIQFLTCVFGELVNGRVIEKGTQVKIARGEMVRFMAENQILKLEDLKYFDRLNYHFQPQLSHGERYVFIKGD